MKEIVINGKFYGEKTTAVQQYARVAKKRAERLFSEEAYQNNIRALFKEFAEE